MDPASVFDFERKDLGAAYLPHPPSMAPLLWWKRGGKICSSHFYETLNILDTTVWLEDGNGDYGAGEFLHFLCCWKNNVCLPSCVPADEFPSAQNQAGSLLISIYKKIITRFLQIPSVRTPCFAFELEDYFWVYHAFDKFALSKRPNTCKDFWWVHLLRVVLAS